MTTTEIIAQAIGIFAMCFNLFSYQQKTRKGAIICQLFGTILFTVNFFLLGAIVGALMNFIGAVRAVIFINKEKLRADHIAWFIGFTAVYIVSYILKKFSLKAFVTTQKLDKLIAAAPNIGFNCQPNIGIQTPAARGIPITL